jgi:predicted Zn-dependent peptidase
MAAQPERAVSIHIELTHQEEKCNIDFPFNTAIDSIDAVLAELVQDVPLTPAEAAVVRKMITDQLAAALSDPADQDPGWLELLERQRIELQDLEAKHQQQQTDMLERIAGRQVRADLMTLF